MLIHLNPEYIASHYGVSIQRIPLVAVLDQSFMFPYITATSLIYVSLFSEIKLSNLYLWFSL